MVKLLILAGAAVVAVLGLGLLSGPVCRESDTAKVQLRHLHEALSLFCLVHGRLPSNDEGLQALTVHVDGKRPMMVVVSRDPWDLDYRYVAPDGGRPGRLVSSGSDRTPATSDDLDLLVAPCRRAPPGPAHD